VHIGEIIASADEPLFSFEFFPPKTPEGEQTLRSSLEALRALEPDFVSVTYGAGGTTRDRTVEITKWIKQDLGIEAMAHLSCVGSSREELYEILDGIEGAGIDNILALRGDPPKGESEWRPHPEGLSYSTELASLISSRYRFCIGAACYPEGHVECPDKQLDWDRAAAKVEAGAEFLITQLFYDNAFYFDFVARARAAGIKVPIIPGLMPIRSLAGIERMTKLSGASLPPALQAELERVRHDEAGTLSLGIAQTTAQAVELLHGGAPGIHFYTLNQSPATRIILTALKTARLA